MTVFIPGKLRNPLNGSWGGWRKHARLAKEWKERTAQRVLLELFCHPDVWIVQRSNVPKAVTFTAHVGAKWDDDNLPAAIKPIRDGLVDAKLIHSDAPDSGHTFRYVQVVDRKQRGVEITIEASPSPGWLGGQSTGGGRS